MLDEQLVNQIVADVLTQLNGQPNTARTEETTNQPLGTKHFSEKVLTADCFQNQLNGLTKITNGSKTVLTPTAKDLLRKKNIAWSIGKKQTAATVNSKPVSWKLITVTATVELKTVTDELHNWQNSLCGSVSEAVEIAVSDLCRAEATGVVVFVNETIAVACQANRNEKVRAAVVENILDVKEAIKQINVNCLCISPTGKSSFELKRIIRAFAK